VLLVKESSSNDEALILQNLLFSKHIVNLIGWQYVGHTVLLEEEPLIACDLYKLDYWRLIPAAVHFLGDGLQALIELQRSGVVHADISPANIMYSAKDEVYKMIDFGHAFRMEDATALSEIRHFRGTKGFTAPEVEAGQIATYSSDLYAFGKVVEWYVFQDFVDRAGDAGVFESPVDIAFASFCRRMVQDDPLKRPSAQQAFSDLIGFWSHYYDKFPCKKMRYSVAARLLRCSQCELQVSPEAEVESTSVLETAMNEEFESATMK
jgi:serine/threonine protein kinase